MSDTKRPRDSRLLAKTLNTDKPNTLSRPTTNQATLRSSSLGTTTSVQRPSSLQPLRSDTRGSAVAFSSSRTTGTVQASAMTNTTDRPFTSTRPSLVTPSRPIVSTFANSSTNLRLSSPTSTPSRTVASRVSLSSRDSVSRPLTTPSNHTNLAANTTKNVENIRASLAKERMQNTAMNATPANRVVTDMQYRRFAAYLEEQSGIVLGEGKQYLVNSRLSTLLTRFQITTVDELINKAFEPQKYKDIASAVIDAMTTNETLWFRDTYPYLALKNMMLPELAKKRKSPVRIWSAACSSGQEPYSIAMIVQEQASQMLHVDPATTQVVGTDISPEMLEKCRKGLYDAHALARGLSPERKQKFFKHTKEPGVMAIDDRIKAMCQFRHMNLLSSYALLGKFDIIFCRNVLIYFNNEVKSSILNKFALSLNPGGYLVLGSSESMSGLTEKYDMVRCNPGLAYRLKS